MRALLFLVSVVAASAVNVQQLVSTGAQIKPDMQNQLPEHVQALITNHINHVLHHANKPQGLEHQQQHQHHGNVLPGVGVGVGQQLPQGVHNHHVTGVVTSKHVGTVPQMPYVVQQQMPQVSGRALNVPGNAQQIIDQVHQHVPQVINQYLSNKVPQINDKSVRVQISLPGQVPQDAVNKVHKLQQHVLHVMHQAQTHIPEVIEHKKKLAMQLEQQQHANSAVVPSMTGRSLNQVSHQVQPIISQVHQHIPQVTSHIQQLQQQQQHNKLASDIPRKCDFDCGRNNLTVCASNRKCIREFSSQCDLAKHNCLNTKNIFSQVDDAECQDSTKVRCYPGDI